MIFNLIAYVPGTVNSVLALSEQTMLKSALGRAEYAVDVLTTLKGDKLFPDMAGVLLGDLVTLSIEIEKIPPYQGELPAPAKDPNVKTTVTELIDATAVRLGQALLMAPKAFTSYRIERVVTHTDFDPTAEADFRALHSGDSFMKVKMPWYVPAKYLEIVGGKVIDSRNGEEPVGIVYL